MRPLLLLNRRFALSNLPDFVATRNDAIGRFCCRSLRLKELGRLKRFLEAAGLRLLGWSGGFDAVAPIPTTTMRRTRRLLVVVAAIATFTFELPESAVSARAPPSALHLRFHLSSL